MVIIAILREIILRFLQEKGNIESKEYALTILKR